MVTGGVSYYALLNGAQGTISTKHPDDLSYEPSGGLAFYTEAYLDTHVGARGREGRML